MRAIVTGAEGQDGFYLTEYLSSLGYEVHGTVRPCSGDRDSAVFASHECDVTDASAARRLIERIRPDEVYNLAAQSHVGRSFENPVLTFNVNAVGCLNILEAIRGSNCKFYQASTSELYGSQPPPQNEETPFHPRSPYAIAKLAAYWLTVNYREAYGLHASNGILFNHESPRRGRDFVTRKITLAVAKGRKLKLGNLDAMRDWGHARDYVKGMHRIVQAEKPGDYVLATGHQRTVREFATEAFALIGKSIIWDGEGASEIGRDEKTGAVLVEVDAALFRPAEVQSLRGDASRAAQELNWRPETPFRELVAEMVASDIGQ